MPLLQPPVSGGSCLLRKQEVALAVKVLVVEKSARSWTPEYHLCKPPSPRGWYWIVEVTAEVSSGAHSEWYNVSGPGTGQEENVDAPPPLLFYFGSQA